MANNTSEFFVRGSAPTKTFNALGDYNDDNENNNDDETNANGSTNQMNKSQSVARRKFEKFRTKLVELFFTNSTTSTTTTTDATAFKTSPPSVNTTNNKSLSPVLLNDALNNTNTNNKRRKSSSTSSSNHFNIDLNLNVSSSSSASSPTNTMLISNYYYGYKTMQFNTNTNTTNEEENHEQIITSKTTKSISKKSKASKSNKTKNITTDCSSTSSLIVDEIESNSCSSSSSYRNSSNNSSSTSSSKHTGELNSNANSIMLSSLSDTNSSNSCSFFHKPSGTIMIDSNYDSLSMTTNIFDFYQQNDATSSSSMMNDGVMASSQVNPFLNKSLTNLISFNSDMSLLDSYFETSLHLIDDQDNFFDIDFMTNYISYILLKRIRTTSCDLVKQLGYDFKMTSDEANNNNDNKFNLLKTIARDIFLQSESEPCGLKGCKISIYFEEHEELNHLLSQFRFDSSSSLTTFELNLVIKKDTQQYTSGLITGLTSTNTTTTTTNSNSPFATLTRRILNRNKTKTVDESDAANTKIIYLNPNDYVLLKIKLY